MLKPSEFFSSEQKAAVESTIADAETKTSCEFIVAITSCSGRYDRGEDIAGLWLGSVAMITAWILYPVNANTEGLWDTSSDMLNYTVWLVALVAGFIVGAVGAARIGRLRLLFTPKREVRDEVESKARDVFFDQRVHRTQGGTGILILISLFEKTVTVLADEKPQAYLKEEAIQKSCDTITSSLGTDSVDGIIEVLENLSTQLADQLPAEPNDMDELSNEIRFID